MSVYLPIAELPVNALLIVSMGVVVGFLSGMFGVGGGFLLTPLLIFAGVPSAVAIATGANPLIASSLTGTVAQYRRRNVDLKLGWWLLAGGALGALAGVEAILELRRSGQLDFVISVLYVILMGAIGGMMLVESARAIHARRLAPQSPRRRRSKRTWIQRLPFKTRLKTSKLYISTLAPLGLGLVAGLLSGVMGVGGGFIVVPVLIYLFRVPTNVAIGTSLFQVIFISAITTVLQAAFNQTVDIVLALMLMIGGVAGAQAGTRAAQHLRAEHLRLLLALSVLSVGIRLAVQLVSQPDDTFTVTASES